MKLGLGLVLAVVLALGLAQLVLPRIAAKAVKDRVSRYGEVRSVRVAAFPAVELLWGQAESVRVSAGALAVAPDELVALLLEAGQVGRLEVRASEVRVTDLHLGAGSLVLGAARLEKRGSAIHASAVVTDGELDAALPSGVTVRIVAGGGGELRVRVTGSLFGFSATVDAVVRAVAGKLELVPSGSLLAGLGRMTIFDEPKLEILGVQAQPQGGGDGRPRAWKLAIDARLR